MPTENRSSNTEMVTVPDRLEAPRMSTGHPEAGQVFATAFYRERARADALTAQLAERDVLLRDSSGKLVLMAAHLIGAPLRELQDLQDEDKRMTRQRVDSAVDFADARIKDAAYEIRQIATALSASTEPSASASHPDRLCHIDYTAHPYRCGCLNGDEEAQRIHDEHWRRPTAEPETKS